MGYVQAPLYICENTDGPKGRKYFFGYRAEFEQNIKGCPSNFEQNKRFLRALPAGRISHSTMSFSENIVVAGTSYQM